INGSPYHWAFDLVAAGETKPLAQGDRQRSVQCVNPLITPGTLTVKKVCLPGNSPIDTFDFTSSAVIDGLDLNDLSCGDDRSASFTGTTTITESQLVPFASWDLTAISCKDDSNDNSVGNLDLANRKITNVTVASGQAVTCTFTNRQAAMPVTKTISGRTPDC